MTSGYKNGIKQAKKIYSIHNSYTNSTLLQLKSLPNNLYLSEFIIPRLTNSIDIIIPVYNGYKFLEPLFSSIYACTSTNHSLIVINDCSTDSNIGFFLKSLNKYKNPYCQNIQVINNSHHLGYVKTVNKAYTLVKNNFVILNTDVEVPIHWLERLMFPIENDTSIASTTPFTNSGTICSFPNWLEDNDLPFNMTVDQIDNIFTFINTDLTAQVIPTGIGFCMGINKSVVNHIGLFDEEIFEKGPCEENDWCQRAIEAGYTNLHITNLFVYHKNGSSFGKNKKHLMAENYKKLLTKHPKYEEQLIAYIKKNALNELRQTLFIKLALASNEVALVLDHGIGGGAYKFLAETIFNTNKLIIYLHGTHSLNEVTLSIIYLHNQCLQIRLPSLQFFMTNFLKDIKVKHCYINHLLTLTDLTTCKQIIKNHSLASSFYVHDFLAICPSYNLINNNGKFCGAETNLDICNSCIAKNKYYYGTHIIYESMNKWRLAYVEILNLCDKIYCFSEDSKTHLTKVYPNTASKIIVKPHTLSFKLPQLITTINYKDKSEIVIGILGTIHYPKGRKILEELAKKPLFKSNQFKLVIIGMSDISIPNVITSGKYRHMELPRLVKKYKVDLFLIPSICPETYCYAAEEIMQMGYPVICFDIGAPAQRIRQYNKGYIAHPVTAQAMYSKIIEVVNLYS